MNREGSLTTPPSVGEFVINRWGLFRSPKVESRYRERHLQADLSMARVCVVVAASAIALFGLTDYRLFGTAEPFPSLIAIRLGFLALSAFLWSRLARFTSPARFDHYVLVWVLVFVALNVAIISTRPPAFLGHLVVNVFTVVVPYTALPMPLPRMTAVSLLHSAALIGVTARAGTFADGMTGTAVVWSFVGANLLGFLTARQFHRRNRELFAAAEEQRTLRAGLERALAEVQTLRGILCICSHCKRVREGERWEAVEVYVRKRTQAQFSHGICPACLTEHYADVLGDTPLPSR